MDPSTASAAASSSSNSNSNNNNAAMNGSDTSTNTSTSRPLGYNRTMSEATGAIRHGSQSATDQRALLARTWSNNHMGDGQQQQPPVAAASGNQDANNNNNAAEFGSSWSGGFVGAPGGAAGSTGVAAAGALDNAAMLAQSWTNLGGGSSNHGQEATAAAVGRASMPALGPLIQIQPQPLPHRTASEGTATPITRASSHTRNPPGVSSAMHDAARLMDWQRVLSICEQNPQSASFVGPGGYTALHHLCSRRCPRQDVAEAVIRACPSSLTMEEPAKGWTPLHFACRFKCKKEVVAMLLNLFPEKGRHTVSKPDRQRRPPLWYAVRYLAPVGVVPLLLEVDPSVILADEQDLESPLAEVWDRFAEKIDGRRALHPFIGDPENQEAPEVLRERLQQLTELNDRWRHANMFLKAAFGFPLSGEDGGEHSDTVDRSWRILHATAAVKCHPTLFQMARALHPEQAREMDDNDLYGPSDDTGTMEHRRQTALHLAASSNTAGPAGRAVITELLRMYPEAARTPDEIDGSYPLHRIAESKHKQHWTFDGINTLYMAHPTAVEKPDQNGKLPLHRAAASISGEQQQVEDENEDNQDGAGADVATRSIICNLLEVYPQAAAVRDNDGCHPLHTIAMNCGDWTREVQVVYDAHERAISTRAGRRFNNALPIHLAAANEKATRSCIERLVELNPRGVSQPDGQGKLPLHLACELGRDWEEAGLESVYNAFTRAVSAREENERHWMALHMACASKQACGNLIRKLVELHPEACEVADSEGRLPFHLACESGKAWEQGLSALFEGFPPAIGTLDNQRRLPLYIVAEQHASAAIARASIETPDVEETDDEEATEVDELDVLYHLVRSDPTTIREAI